MTDGFGADLWKNVQAMKLHPDGGIEAPVRADGAQGINVGVDAVAKTDGTPAARPPRTPGRMRTLLRRLARRT